LLTLILAGGSGSRLWPLSTSQLPKQFLRIIGDQSLLQLAAQRCRRLNSKVNLITQQRYRPLAQEQVPDATLILEPVARSTAPALMLALRSIQIEPDEPILVSTADHLISPEESFVEAAHQAAQLAQNGYLVTFGVRPTHPETGFGYIEVAPDQSVRRFVEKPDLITATQFLASGHHYWNSGMLCFTPRTFWQQLQMHAPHLGRYADAPLEQLHHDFPTLPSISIDYALMEHSTQVAMVPLSCTWSDVGSWDQLYHLLAKDPHSNAIHGPGHPHNSRNSLIYAQGRPIALIDCDDLIVIDSDDALLIAKRGSSQQVRHIAHKLMK
jgi:mannose-1-phosphate guanylyltransferase/mannose-6-phosphate isomerase